MFPKTYIEKKIWSSREKSDFDRIKFWHPFEQKFELRNQFLKVTFLIIV